MSVQDLINLLENCDPNMEVLYHSGVFNYSINENFFKEEDLCPRDLEKPEDSRFENSETRKYMIIG